jgi:hypothetical protein
MADPINAQLLGVTADDTVDFAEMTNTVYLAAQLEVKSGLSSSIKNIFDKQAKYYYGVQTTDGIDKRMYRKNTAKMDRARLSTEDARKDLDVVTENDAAKVGDVKAGIQQILQAVGTETTESTQNFFNATQISEGGKVLGKEVSMGTGARVALIAKYNIVDGKVSAFGKLLFIKKDATGTASLNLVIKDNTIMTGSSVGAGIYMSELLQTLFGAGQAFTFDENSLAPVADADEAARVAAEVEAARVADLNALSDPATVLPARNAMQEELLANRPPVKGGKSTRRKRKGSRKKGGAKKPVSHKKRKSGASKKRRSHPKKK